MSRRGILRGAGVGAAGLAGAALIGCGDDDDDDDGAATASPGATQAPEGTAAPTSGAPERGGTYRLAMVEAPDHYDMHRTTAASTYHVTRWAHSKLMQWTPGNGQFASGEMEGDLVASWEQPDDLTYHHAPP